jgi:ubiquinone/menaquinone biosynthesis C-methylase UbiE
MIDESLQEVVEFYTDTKEEARLQSGPALLEFERTKQLLARVLPPPPADVVDVGGASGPYAFWLASQGYAVHLVDVTPRLVQEASRRSEAASHRLASIAVGDARKLAFDEASVDGVLICGPLYHLPESVDRVQALREARRVLRPNGVVAAAGISRYAGTLDGLIVNPTLDAAIIGMRHRALLDGRYRNDTNNRRYFVTAYFHRPEDLARELNDAGFEHVQVFGVEGPGWLLSDFEARWSDLELRQRILDVARLLEQEVSIVGVSPHILAVGDRGQF